MHDRFFLGTIVHGPRLRQALDEHRLDNFFQQLGYLYAEEYGKKPWNEHVVCTQKDCREKKGMIDEAHIIEENEKFHEHPENFRCPKCSASMELFYPPEKLFENLKDGFKKKVFASLLFDESRILSGFCLGWATTIGNGYRDKVILGTGDDSEPFLSFEEYWSEAQEVLGSTITMDTEVFNAAEWVISTKFRNQRVSLPTLYALFSAANQTMVSMPGHEVPVIAHTLVDSKAFSLVKKIGWATGKQHGDSPEIRLYSTIPTLMRGIEALIS